MDILFEDNHMLVLAKPAPLLTQAPPGVPSLESLAKDYLKAKYHKPGNVYLGVPHRLDRPVSGVVVFARNSKSAERLAEQFRERTVTKIYWALVEGEVSDEEGVWRDWLRKLKDEARSERAEPESLGAKLAELKYRRLQSTRGGDWLELQPLTGRMHQIRLQASLHDCPVLGDRLYGGKLPFGPAADLARDRCIALHARSLTIRHPIRYEPMSFVAPLPDTWSEFVNAPTDLSG